MKSEKLLAWTIIIGVISIISTVFFYITIENNAVDEKKEGFHFETLWWATLMTIGITWRMIVPIPVVVFWLWGLDLKRFLQKIRRG